MAPVTVDATARNSYYSAGNIGWQAKSAFAYRTAIQQLVGASVISWGNGASTAQRAFSFTTSGAIDVNELRTVLSKNSSPTDNVSLAIYSDASNLPGTLIQTADNLYNGANVSGTASWAAWQFATPVALSASTKYWLVYARSGAVDGTNNYNIYYNNGGVLAGGGTSFYNGSVWSAETAANDWMFQVLTVTPSALYQLAQDTGGSPKLHMWKSTDDGASWTEQDSANAPTVTDGTYPFDGCETRSGPYIGIVYFTATNTLRMCAFDMSSDTWGSDFGGANVTANASNERSVRCGIYNDFVTASVGRQWVGYTSLADDADLNPATRTTSTWSTGGILAVTSAEASLLSAIVLDKSPIGFVQAFYYDVSVDDFSLRSSVGLTQGTQVDLDTAAADVETEHASACYQIYQASGVDRVIAAYIAADGSIEERTALLEVTSASVTLGTQHAVGTATTSAGRQLASCSFGGDLYLVASVSGTGIDYYVDTGAAGSWSGPTNWKTGLTASSISNVLSIEGYGLLVTYTDNGDVKVDWISAPASGTPASLTVTAATATAAGEAVTLDAAAKMTVTEATAPAAGQAVTLTGQGRLAVGAATALAAGEAVTLDAASLFTVAPATAPAAGGAVVLAAQGRLPVTEAIAPAAEQAVTLAGQGRLPVTGSTALAAGEAVTFDAVALFTVDAAPAPAAGGTVNLYGAAVFALDAASAPAQGEAVDLVGTASVAGTLTVAAAESAAAGAAVTLTGQARLAVDVATAPAEGENVVLFGGTSIPGTLSVAPATAPAQGEAVTFDAASVFAIAAAAAPAQAAAVTLTAAALMAIAASVADATGANVSLTGHGTLAITEATAPAAADGAFQAAANFASDAALADALAASELTAGVLQVGGILIHANRLRGGPRVIMFPPGYPGRRRVW